MLNFIKRHKYLSITIPIIITLMIIIIINTENILLLGTFTASAVLALISATIIDIKDNKQKTKD